MRNFATLKNLYSQPLSWTIAFLLGLGITTTLNPVRAEPPETAPAELTGTINQIDAAARRQDLEAVIEFYSPNFTNSDGLRRTSVSKALTQLWERYPQLDYETRILSWERDGDNLIAETETAIRGTAQNGARQVRLNSTIRSRQYFEDQQLVRQEILSERSDLTSGENPPEVQVVLPEQVSPGERYNFDVIVTEPLGNEVLLGTAVEESTGSDRYLDPASLELEILPAGGIYKLVKAPLLPDQRWLSAILVQSDGIRIITQRVRVEE